MSTVKIFNAYIRTTEPAVFLREAKKLRNELYIATDLRIDYVEPPRELAISVNCNALDVYESWLDWYFSFAELLIKHSELFIIYWIGEHECAGVPIYLKCKNCVQVGYILESDFRQIRIYDLPCLIRNGSVSLKKISGESPELFDFHDL